MSVIETIEAIRSGLMWIGLSALAAIAVGVVGAWLYRGRKVPHAAAFNGRDARCPSGGHAGRNYTGMAA